MKNTKKLIPSLAVLALLVGCDNTPTLSSKKDTIYEGDVDSEITADTYQDIFEDLYASQGVSTAYEDMLLKIAKTVLANSENWSENGSEETLSIQGKLLEKTKDAFDTFYENSNYQENGLFVEEKLVKSLRSQGYTIVRNVGTSIEWEETISEKLANEQAGKGLYEVLTENGAYNYSEYIEDIQKDFYQELLKEEYILSKKFTGASGTYFTNKDVRVVKYFKYTPDNSTVADSYAEKFEELVKESIANEESFTTLVHKDGGLESEWKLHKLDLLAKDFALINGKAGVVNTNLPTYYQAKVAEYETKWQADETYGYKDIFDGQVWDASDISDVKSKLDTYSESGARSIYEVYYEKQLEILTASYFTEDINTSDNGNVISSVVQDVIEDLDDENIYAEGTSYIDVYDTDTVVFKYSSDYYVLTATEIKDTSSLEERYEAAEALAKVSSNVKNCYYEYLTSLTEEGKLEIHNQDLYDYLEKTYGYGEED